MRRCILLVLLAASLAAPVRARDEACEIPGVPRVVAIGDVPGAYSEFLAVLRLAGLIDQKDRWSGGKTHFVQTGDILDRGTETRGNPTYVSVYTDPRVGISLLEMAFLGLYSTAAVVSNPRLFLWRFLAADWTNRVVFGLLFANQFVAPHVVALLLSRPGVRGPGVELFVMFAGVVTTMSFLLLQARLARRRSSVPGLAA